MISSFVTDGVLAVHFPRLMRALDNPALIVLFANEGLGTVVAVGHAEEIHTIGDISDGWNAEGFEIFNGEVSICNEADDGCDDELLDIANHFAAAADEGDEATCCGQCQGVPVSQDPQGFLNGKPFFGTLAEAVAKDMKAFVDAQAPARAANAQSVKRTS